MGVTIYSAGKEVMKIAKNIANAAWNGFKSAGRAIGSGIKSAGLSLGIYAVPTSEEIASFFENQGMQYVTEEVLWKNLEKILLKSNFRKIKAVVEKDKANKDYIKRISKRVSNKLEVLYSDEFHDRFWISNRKAGFLTGTSLNGIGENTAISEKLKKKM